MTKKSLYILAALFLAAITGSAAIAYSAESQALQGSRGRMESRQHLISPINKEGPEAWPENEGLSTVINEIPESQNRQAAEPQKLHLAQDSAVTAQPNPATADSAAQQPKSRQTGIGSKQAATSAQVPKTPQETHLPNAGTKTSGTASTGDVGVPMGKAPAVAEPVLPERPVIYVDEAGNPVPKPLEPDKMYADAVKLIDQGKFDDALPILEQIKALPNIKPDLREKVLYGISDCVWAHYVNDPLAGYEPIVSATSEAMNANLRSARMPDALLRLGLANINVGNLSDGQGYIVALMRRFPDFPGIPQGFTALGNAFLKAGKNAEAEKAFAIILDKYPESSQLQAASVGLAKALVKQDKDERAQVILDFISKRWPRYYIDDPDFLLMQAKNDEKMNMPDAAMALHWLYVNLDPKRPANAPLMLKMADIYSKNGNQEAANYIYSELEQKFPETRAAVAAKARLAEQGIYDSPITYEQMKPVFDKYGRTGLWAAYNDLAKGNGEDEILARLKQAMWLYWDKQYPEAMGKAADFIDNYPDHKDIKEAREIIWNAFNKELDQSLKEHNYGRILLLWNGFPYIRERYGELDPALRYALAQGWLERGDNDKSFALMEKFLAGPKDEQFGEAAFSQFFNHYLQNGAWDKILELGQKVKNWKMTPELANQLQYAEALSAQNLKLGAQALNRWKDLSHKTDIPLYQQAYATYFLAKDAENRRDIRNSYELNRKVVEMFSRLSDERSSKADPDRIKEGISSLMDICEVGNRVPEALQWLERYNAFVPDGSAEYPGLRFREARLYRKLGDNTRSRALLEDVAQRFPESPFAQAAAAELRTFDVSRDLQRYASGTPDAGKNAGTGSTSGNWSSTAPSEQKK